MNMVIIGLNDRRAAEEVLDELELASDEWNVVLEDLALIYRSRSGRSKVRHTGDVGSGPGLLRGGLVGLLVAIVPPVGSMPETIAGGALGGVIAGVGGNSVDNETMRSLAAVVHEHEGVVVVLGDQTQLRLLHDVFESHSDHIRCLPVPEATRNLIRKLSQLSMDDLVNAGRQERTASLAARCSPPTG